MAFSYIGNNSTAEAGVTEIDLGVPAGVAAGQLIVGLYAFENVAAGSGPWIVPNIGQLATDYIGPSTGWQQLCFQAPSGTGVGIEVWGAIFTGGTHQWAQFSTAQNAAACCTAYSGELNPSGNISGAPPRTTATRQVTGHQPAAPSVNANQGDLVVAVGGHLMTGSKFGTPSGFTNRIDILRSGAGTVDAAIADATATVAGSTGLITFPNNASTSSTLGATATLAFSPSPSTPGSGALLEAPMPPNLDLGPGWTLRVTALSTVDGSVVSGVSVSNFGVLVQDTGEATSNLQTGPYMLVPGPNA